MMSPEQTVRLENRWRLGGDQRVERSGEQLPLLAERQSRGLQFPRAGVPVEGAEGMKVESGMTDVMCGDLRCLYIDQH